MTARTDEGHRRAAARIVVLLALLLGAPVAQAAAPAGDDRVTPAVVGLDNLVGDLQPLRLESGAQAFGIDVSGATAAPDDPALDQADRGSSCAGASGSASASVWYTLRGPGRTPIGEAAWVGIDTVGSTFRNGLQVFVVAPDGLQRVACERENLAAGNAAVHFGMQPDAVYLLQVAVTGPTSGSLTLRGRALDIQEPRVSIRTPSTAAQPGRRSAFEVVGGAAVDLGSGVDPTSYRWEIAFTPAGGVEQVLPAVVDASGTAAAVVWPAATGIGTARLTVGDLAGRSTTASLSVTVRDRAAPRVNQAAVVPLRRGRPGLRVSASCNEPGRVSVRLLRGGKVIRTIHRSSARRPPRVNQAWRVRRGAYAVAYTCRDAARNLSLPTYRLLFLR